MEKMLAVDKLARPADHILLRTERAFKGRIDQGLSPFAPMPYEDDFLKSRMHGICAGEFQAMEAAGRTLFDFPDAPWEFQLDMARQVWDESRHAEIYMKLLEYTGSWYGEFPEGHRLWSCTESDDPAARVAGINRGLEGLACDVFEQLIRMAQAMGDKVIERSIDYVLADEITHVRMGSRWMRKLTEGDPERLQRALEFQERFDQQVGTNGRALPEEVEKVKQIYDGREIELEGRLAIAREARLQAGFTEEEIEKLVHPTVSREKMLRDRGLSEDEIAKMLKGFGKSVAY